MDDLPAPAVPAIAIHRESALRFGFAGGMWIILAEAAATSGNLTSLEALYRRGPMLPKRRHDREDQFYYILDGELAVTIGKASPRVVSAGSFVFVPRGIVHETRVVSDTSRVYQSLMPGGLAEFIARFGTPANNADVATIPHPASKEPTLEDWRAIGVTVYI